MTEYKGKKNTEKEVAHVIRHIREMLERGDVIPGERLPAERKISADTGVSRAKVRLALERLESYGLVTILPQSGTILSSQSRTALIRQISSILDSNSFDFNSLVQVRNLLERESVRLCAERHTPEDVVLMEKAMQEFVDNVHGPLRDEKDFAFHSTIARCCHNSVIYHLLLMITPDVLAFYRRLRACATLPEDVVKEHLRILECIKNSDPDGAEQALKSHFADITAFAAANTNEVPRFRL